MGGSECLGNLLFIYLFGVLRHFQHCTGHITTGSWKGRGNQCIQFIRVLYCKLPTNGKQLPAFPLETMLGIEPQPQRWESRVLPLCHRGRTCDSVTKVIFIGAAVYVDQNRFPGIENETVSSIIRKCRIECLLNSSYLTI